MIDKGGAEPEVEVKVGELADGSGTAKASAALRVRGRHQATNRRM